jgi:hypothetical protein
VAMSAMAYCKGGMAQVLVWTESSARAVRGSMVH